LELGRRASLLLEMKRLVGVAWEASRDFFILGEEMGNRGQDLSIMALVMRDDRMTRESREFYKIKIEDL
jgi:hypothetical protein